MFTAQRSQRPSLSQLLHDEDLFVQCAFALILPEHERDFLDSPTDGVAYVDACLHAIGCSVPWSRAAWLPVCSATRACLT